MEKAWELNLNISAHELILEKNELPVRSFGQTAKTNNAVKHDRLRTKQSDYLDSHHHPQEKLKQLTKT